MICPENEHLEIHPIYLGTSTMNGGGILLVCLACGKQTQATTRGRWLEHETIEKFVRMALRARKPTSVQQ